MASSILRSGELARIAHLISDAIYERITGEKGYFDTRIVFISEAGPATNRKKKLAVMDEDGANPIFLTKGDYMVLTPRFNPTAQMIAYSPISTESRAFICSIWRVGVRRCWEISRT
ncbi:MAG: hypothetical protein WDM89_14905 [Rhizomicrobium sp.]